MLYIIFSQAATLGLTSVMRVSRIKVAGSRVPIFWQDKKTEICPQLIGGETEDAKD